MKNSEKTKAQRLSEAVSDFDTVLEQDPQVQWYQMQPSQPDVTPAAPPGLPLVFQLQWVLLLSVHLVVLWFLRKK
ncbi:hypothetical protein NG791_09985 [Laspinema sp. D1]|uniref:hypothetical protein n=1 Tax=Laspinema palackyanum TaxID=3231601 RepID=UPI00347A68CC|nr:hypothetical protein [Laspinema sp. D2b]